MWSQYFTYFTYFELLLAEQGVQMRQSTMCTTSSYHYEAPAAVCHTKLGLHAVVHSNYQFCTPIYCQFVTYYGFLLCKMLGPKHERSWDQILDLRTKYVKKCQCIFVRHAKKLELRVHVHKVVQDLACTKTGRNPQNHGISAQKGPVLGTSFGPNWCPNAYLSHSNL